MTEEQKQKLIEYTEFVLRPIQGKFMSVDKPLVMYSMIRDANDHRDIMSEENKIIVYYLNFFTDFGDVSMSFHSDNLTKDLKSAVCVSCGYSSSLHTAVPANKLHEINIRIGELYRNNDL